jgi:nucleoside-diphosphate-sugar epimerase
VVKNRHRVLVTGATGLLAHEFINEYRSHYEIYAVTHSPHATRFSDVKYIEIDFSSDWNATLLPREIDFIIHLSQSPKFRDFPNAAIEVFKVNLQSTMMLLDYAVGAKVQKFILASTGGIYGSSSSPISTNSEILSPTGLGHYFGSKLSAEIFANNYREYFAVDINRIFFMYGPRQSKSMLIPRLIDSVTTGKIIQLAGKDGISINPVYVDDVAHFLNCQLKDLDSYVYNIAGPDTVSIRDLSMMIRERFGGSLNFKVTPPSSDIVADASDFLSSLPIPPVPIFEGIRLFSLE